MKTKTILAACLLTILLSQCDDRADNKNAVAGNEIFTKSVGGPISAELAASWVERKRSHSSGREENFSVSAVQLNALLEKTDDKLGVILHHAEDASGEHHLFVAPVKSDLLSWTNGSVLDAVSNEFVDAQTAAALVSDYKTSHPEGPWSHFYGIELFDEITSLTRLTRIDFVAGEDASGLSQILLYAWRESSNGKVKQESSVYDQSAVCPPVCPTN
jgi:hypothetical protein